MWFVSTPVLLPRRLCAIFAIVTCSNFARLISAIGLRRLHSRNRRGNRWPLHAEIALHNVPNRLYRHPTSTGSSHFVDATEQFASINCGCGEPILQFGSHPIRNRNRSNVASLADQINDGPMLFALLEMICIGLGRCRTRRCPHASQQSSLCRESCTSVDRSWSGTADHPCRVSRAFA